MNAHAKGGPRVAPKTAQSPRSDRLTAWQADAGIRALAAHLRDRAALREVAARAESLAAFLDLARRRAEAVAARNLADRARQALR